MDSGLRERDGAKPHALLIQGNVLMDGIVCGMAQQVGHFGIAAPVAETARCIGLPRDMETATVPIRECLFHDAPAYAPSYFPVRCFMLYENVWALAFWTAFCEISV